MPTVDQLAIWPIVVPIPAEGTTGVSIVYIDTIPEYVRIWAVKGYLRTLSSGTFTVTLKDTKDQTLFAQLDWTAGGDAEAPVDYTLAGQGTGIKICVPSAGTGAEDCTVTIWAWVRMAGGGD